MKNKFLLITALLLTLTSAFSAPVDKFDTITTNSPTKLKVDFLKGINFTSTDSLKLPVGTTGQRDVTPVTGMVRVNSTNNLPEIYYAAAWRNLLTFTSNLVIPVELDMNSHKIVNLTDPSGAQDAATKSYVDSSVGGIDLTNYVDRSTTQSVGGNKTFTGNNTFSNTITGSISGNAATVTTIPTLLGEAGNSGNTITLNNNAVIAKTLNGYTAGAGTVSSADSLIQAIQKLDGNSSNASVIARTLTGFTSGAGVVSSADSILSALQKVNGNVALKLGNTKSDIDVSAVATTQINVPNDQLTTVGTNERRLETGNSNILKNPSFEAATPNTGWSCTGTISVSTDKTDGNQALGVVSSGTGVRCYQAVTTNSASLKGLVGVASVRVKTTDTVMKACALVDGVNTANERNCVNIAAATTDKPFNDVNIPYVMGGTSNGIVIYTATTTAQPTSIDEAFVGRFTPSMIGLLGNAWASAVLSSSGTVSQESSDFINGNCPVTGTAVFTCTLNTNYFKQNPNCLYWPANSGIVSGYTAMSTATVAWETRNSATQGLSPAGGILFCTKTGSDYAESSGSGYLVQNGNYTARPYTPTFSASLGTVTSPICTESRVGQFNEIECSFTTGSTIAGEVRVSLPTGAVIASNVASLQPVGSAWLSYSAGAGVTNNFQVLASPGNNYVTFNDVATTTLQSVSGVTITSSKAMGFKARVRIQGWDESPVSIAPLTDVPTVRGSGSNMKFFGGRIDTICSSGTCSMTRTYGTNQTSTAFVSTGIYDVNFNGCTTDPVCNANISAVASQTNKCQPEAGPSNTKLRILCFNTGASPVNEGFAYSCMCN